MKKNVLIFSTLCVFLMSAVAPAQTLQDALIAKEKNKYQQAKSILLSLSANPSNAELFYQLGLIYAELENTDSSKFFFKKAIEVFPAEPLSTVCIGLYTLNEGTSKIIVLASGTIDPSKAILDAILGKNPKDAKLLNQTAQACVAINEKNADYALELLAKSATLDKKNETTFILSGDVYLIKLDGSAAIANYNKALALNPKNVRAQVSVGRIYAQTKNYEAALNAYTEATAMDASYPPIYKYTAETYYQKRQYDKAVENYSKYIELSERSVTSLSRLASFLFLAKDYNKSIEVINEVIKIDSSNAILSRLIGYSYYEQQQFQKAKEFMEKFFKDVDSKKIIASDYEYYGKALSKTGQDSLSVLNLKKSLELDTTQAELYVDLGDVNLHWRKYADAAKAYSKKIEKTRNPSAIDYFNLGKSYYFDKQYGKADTAFTKVTELKPNAAIGYFWRGRTNSVDVENNLEAPKPFYEKYIELASTDAKSSKKDLAEAYGYLGYYFIQKDDNASAKLNYKKVLELDPENKQAREVLKNIP